MSASRDEPEVIDGQLDIYDQLNDEAEASSMPALTPPGIGEGAPR